MRSILFFLFFTCSAMLAGCAVVPAQEMSDARQAIQAAEAVDAEDHAPRALGLARALLDQAELELAVKDYSAARSSARASKAAAIQAREAADDMVRAQPELR
jgi:hypothetical protein